MAKARKSSTDRLKDIANIFNAMPAGEAVGQQELMRKLDMSPGQWNTLKTLLDTYVQIQGSNRVERHFMPQGKRVVTKYRISSIAKASYPEII